MLVTFANEYLETLYHQQVLDEPKYSQTVIDSYIHRIDQFIAADTFDELRLLTSLHIDDLKAGGQGFYSVRLEGHYRLTLHLEYDHVKRIEIVVVESIEIGAVTNPLMISQI